MVTIDHLGELADKCDDIIAMSKLPLPPEIHLDQMRTLLDEIQSKLKHYYIEITHKNPWE